MSEEYQSTNSMNRGPFPFEVPESDQDVTLGAMVFFYPPWEDEDEPVDDEYLMVLRMMERWDLKFSSAIDTVDVLARQIADDAHNVSTHRALTGAIDALRSLRREFGQLYIWGQGTWKHDPAVKKLLEASGKPPLSTADISDLGASLANLVAEFASVTADRPSK